MILPTHYYKRAAPLGLTFDHLVAEHEDQFALKNFAGQIPFHLGGNYLQEDRSVRVQMEDELIRQRIHGDAADMLLVTAIKGIRDSQQSRQLLHDNAVAGRKDGELLVFHLRRGFPVISSDLGRQIRIERGKILPGMLADHSG